jgi:uncharacterized cupredoxin-like copper-binding protein
MKRPRLLALLFALALPLVAAPLPANATFAATFTPAEPGRYRFYCGSPGHAAAGREGGLVVEP